MSEDLITRIPQFPAVQRPKRKKINWYNTEQQTKLFEFCEEPIFQFLRWTGCRPSEGRGLQKNDIDWDKREISIQHSLPMAGFKVKGTKTDSIKTIRFFKELEDCLKAGLETSPKSCLFLFTINGEPYSRKMLFKGWEEMVQKAHLKYNLPKLPMYQGLKHSLAMQLLNEDGRSLSDVKEALGHADIRSTEHYTEMLPGRRAEILGNRSNGHTKFTQEKINTGKEKWLGDEESNLGIGKCPFTQSCETFKKFVQEILIQNSVHNPFTALKPNRLIRIAEEEK